MATATFLESAPTKSATVVSLIHADGIVAPGSLAESTALRTLKDSIKAALHAAGIRRAVVGIDFSFNEDRENEFESHWLVHVRAVVPRSISKRTRQRLRAQFPKRDQIQKPTQCKALDGNLAGIAYSMKSTFGRRESYVTWKYVPSKDEVRTCRDTRGRPLRGPEAVELAIYLNRIGLRNRLMIGGARLTTSPNGAPVIARRRTLATVSRRPRKATRSLLNGNGVTSKIRYLK